MMTIIWCLGKKYLCSYITSGENRIWKKNFDENNFLLRLFFTCFILVFYQEIFLTVEILYRLLYNVYTFLKKHNKKHYPLFKYYWK